jgi:hypothetical protein
MMQMSRLVTLMAAVGLTAACGSVPPTAPNVPLAPGPATVSDGVVAIDGSLPTGSGACKGVVAVVLQVVPHPHDGVAEIRTSYKIAGWEPCLVPPTWTANRPGLRINEKDRFRAEMDRRPAGSTTVYATAPNGVTGRIKF